MWTLISLLYWHVCSVYASVFSVSNVGLCALWCAIRCVCSGRCAWSSGTGCVHSCIDAITLSSAYLTAQTFFFLLPTPFAPSLSLSACFPFPFLLPFTVVSSYFTLTLAFLYSPFLSCLTLPPSLSLLLCFLTPLLSFSLGQYCVCWGFSGCSF